MNINLSRGYTHGFLLVAAVITYILFTKKFIGPLQLYVSVTTGAVLYVVYSSWDYIRSSESPLQHIKNEWERSITGKLKMIASVLMGIAFITEGIVLANLLPSKIAVYPALAVAGIALVWIILCVVDAYGRVPTIRTN